MIDTFEKERNRYIDFFKRGIEYLKTDKSQFAVELLIESNDTALTHPFNLLRLDFIYKDELNIDRINSLQLDTKLTYEKVIANKKNSKITINPFLWGNCTITFEKIIENNLILWIEKWIDVQDSRYTEYSNSIHNCSLNKNANGLNELTVDFGTAPVESMIELIDLLTIDNSLITIK